MTARLTEQTIRAGVWSALYGPLPELAEPALEALHLGQPLGGQPLGGLRAVRAEADGIGWWRLSLPLPADLLDDRLQTVVLRDVATGETLGRIAVAAGGALAGDIAAEVSGLRAELDLLKTALRRLGTQG